MTLSTELSLVGLALGLVGSAVLTFSLNPLLGALTLASSANDFTVGQMIDGTDIVRFENVSKRLQRDGKASQRRTRIGFGMMLFGFGFQAAALIFDGGVTTGHVRVHADRSASPPAARNFRL